MCSKLDFFLSGIRNQPHLWMSRQPRYVSRPSPDSGLYQLPPSISKSKFPSSCIHNSFGSFFSRRLWISPSFVEIWCDQFKAHADRRVDTPELISGPLLRTFGLGPTQ